MSTTENHDGPGIPNRTPRGGGADEDGDPDSIFDPYYFYAVDTDFRFLGRNKAEAYPVLLELTRPLLDARKQLEERLHVRIEGLVQFSELFLRPPVGLEDARYVTALVGRKFFDAAKEGLLNGIVRRFELCVPRRDFPLAWPGGGDGRGSEGSGSAGATSEIPAQLQQAGPSSAGAKSAPSAVASSASSIPQGVLVGVIDDAMAFANRRFRSADGLYTRLHAFWGQDLDGGVNPGPWPSGGRILTANDINYALKNSTTSTTLDEDAVYRRTGLTYYRPGHKSWGRRCGHGTAVLDIAAGLDGADVSSTSPAIVAVQLPIAVTVDSTGGLLSSYAIDGLQWIMNCAEVLKPATLKAMPAVVNLSYGTLAGPHDGTGMLASAIDEKIRLCRAAGKKFSVVLPAGNGHLSQTHAQALLKANGASESTLRWRILPDGKTPSFVEVWLPFGTLTGEIEVQVTTPAGHQSGWIRENDPVYRWPSSALPLLWIRHRSGMNPQHRKRVLIGVYPTAAVHQGDRVAPSGTWRVSLRAMGNTDRTVDAFIRRNDTPAGFPVLGRQSRFEDAHYLETRYDRRGRLEENDDGHSAVCRAGTISDIASGKLSVVAGGFRDSDLSMARYSAGGPTAVPASGPPRPRSGPDASLVSEQSYALDGILAAGTRTGSTVALNGTSVAAPQITRWIASAMRMGTGDGLRSEVAAEADAQEVARAGQIKPNGPLEPKPTELRGGTGRIRLGNWAGIPKANRLRRP